MLYGENTADRNRFKFDSPVSSAVWSVSLTHAIFDIVSIQCNTEVNVTHKNILYVCKRFYIRKLCRTVKEK